MQKEEVKSIIVAVLTDIQTKSGRDIPSIGNTFCPIVDLPGFDSLSGLEATVDLEHKLGTSLYTNIFLNEEGTQALSISEITENLHRIINKGGSL